MLRCSLPLALALFAACSSIEVPVGPAVQELSGAMPSLAGRTLTGGTIGPADYAGRVVLVNFWATSCAPCRRELPVLTSAHDPSGEGPFVVGVNFREGASVAREFVEDLGVSFQSLRDPDGSVAHRFGVPFLPTTVLIDADGRLRYRVTGEIDEATLAELLAELTAAQAS